MRVLHVIAGLDRGGAETYLADLLQATRGQLENHVVALRPGGALRDRVAAVAASLTDLGVLGRGAMLAAPARLDRVIERVRPDLVQGWMVHGNLLSTLGRAARRRRLPVVWSLLDVRKPGSLERRTTLWLVRWGVRRSRLATAVVYNSQAGAASYERLGYNGRPVVIPSGVDAERFRPSPAGRAQARQGLGVGDQELVVGRVARNHPVKGYGDLLAACPAILQADSHVTFVFVGRGLRDDAQLARDIDERGLRTRIRMLDERPDLENLYPGFDVTVSPSREEALPLVVLESLACGVPVVATNVGDTAAAVGPGGRIVPPADPAAFAAATSAMLALPTARLVALGQAGRKHVAASYSLAASAQAYLNLYASLLAGTGTRPHEAPRPRAP